MIVAAGRSLAIALLATLLLAGGDAASRVELHEIAHPSLRFRTPGLDGFVGTADDVIVACVNPGPDAQCGTDDDVDATPLNPNGSTGFVFIDEIVPILGFDFVLLFGDGSGGLEIETAEPLGTPGSYPDFSISARTLPPGPVQYHFDVPGDPHEIRVAADQTFTIEYRQQTCFDAPTCSIPNLLLDLAGELTGRGVLLFRGQDPADLLPVLDPANAQQVVDYLGFLTTLLPDDWSAVALTVFGPGRLTPDNTRGLIAGGLHDGRFVFVNALYAVPEPQAGAALLLMAPLAVWARWRARRVLSPRAAP